MPIASVIISTYNRPDALEAVLTGFSSQTCNNFEVLIADDGSTEETADTILQFAPKAGYPLRHIWHEDKGFRVAMIRNRTVAQAQGEYLIFVDGDCIPLPHFIERHLRMAEQGWFTAGNRILLSKKFTRRVLQEKVPIHNWGDSMGACTLKTLGKSHHTLDYLARRYF